MLKLICLEFSNSFQFISHFPLSSLLPFSHSHPTSLYLLSLTLTLLPLLPPCVPPACLQLPCCLLPSQMEKRPEHHCRCRMDVLGRYSRDWAALPQMPGQGEAQQLSLLLERPFLGLWELGSTRNRHCPFSLSFLHRERK